MNHLSVITDGENTNSYYLCRTGGLASFRLFINTVVARIPRLQSFKLNYMDISGVCKTENSEHSPTFVSVVSYLLTKLRDPRSIELCPKLAPSIRFSPLTSLERLCLRCHQHSFEHQWKQEQHRPEYPGDASTPKPITTYFRLKRLSTLTLKFDYKTAKVFIAAFSTYNLMHLEIESPRHESDEIYDLLTAIVDNCAGITTLHLKSADDIIFPKCHSLGKCLQDLRQMRFFFLHQDLTIPDCELKEVLLAWPQLEELHLLYRIGGGGDAAAFTPDTLPLSHSTVR